MKLDELIDLKDKTGVKEVPIDKPGAFNVMILNNHVTPFEVVVEALMAGIGLSEAEATKRMMRAHKTGWAAVAAYASSDVAETVASKIERSANTNDRYEKYRKFNKHKGPWPLDTEVMEAG